MQKQTSSLRQERSAVPGFFHRVAVIAVLLLPLCAHGGGVVTNATEGALNTALSGGGVVTLAFNGTITVSGPKTISSDTTIDATGYTATISGGNSVQVFSVDSGKTLMLRNLTIAHGRSSTTGGAIYNSGNLTAYGCAFMSNSVVAAAGGNGSTGNPGTAGGDAYGGAIYSLGTLTLRHCSFMGNLATGGAGGNGGNGNPNGGNGGAGGKAYGGAIYSTGSMLVSNSSVSISTVTGGHGGTGGAAGISGESGNGGGGAAAAGAGVYSLGSSMIINSTFFANWATGGNSEDSGNENSGDADNGPNGGTAFGGGIFSAGTMEVINSTFASNEGFAGHGGEGGDGYVDSGRGGHGGLAAGGGIYNTGTVAVVNCTFAANKVTGGNGANGGSTGFAGNGGDGGDGSGGGIYNFSKIGVTNCTFYTNSALGGTEGLAGGGYPAEDGDPGDSQGAAIARAGGGFTLKNSILAYKPSGDNANGTITNAGNNISSDSTPSFGNNLGSTNNLNPKLLPLADNGGFTMTCALASDSRAINTGDTTKAPQKDQRGLYRTFASDIGAYEYNGSSVNYVFVNVQAVDNYGTESGTNRAAFSITRTGKTNEAITVGLSVSGTAVSGTDYTALPTNIVLAAGVTVSNLVVTPLQNAPTDELAETIVVGLKSGTNYLPGLYTNAVVTLSGDGATARSSYPTGERYLRGSGTNLDYYTIVVPLDGLRGTSNANMIPGGYTTLYHYNGALGGTQTTTNNRIAFNSTVATFGSDWGTPLYVAQSYSMGVKFGAPVYDPIEIAVFNKTNGGYVGVINVNVPDSSDWATFAGSGFAQTASGYGLKTELRAAADSTWGTSTIGYSLTHTADATATNYVYLVTASGKFNGQEVCLNSAGHTNYGYLYELVFDVRPTWRSVFLNQPHFTGEPLPPDLLNKTPEELLNYGALVTNSVSLSPSSCTNLDQSPELRRHPLLDRFVSDLNNDPFALANYVQNEIDLTDAIAHRDNGQVNSESVNQGGVNRGALGVYLEGQGSPMEQCALLIYLLRQAGYPAAYVFPPDGGLKMLDKRLSTLMRMQLVGAQDDLGHLFTTNRLIPVNYPWVAAHVNGQWVHLFPWLKDTQVIEGLDLYDHLPDTYKQLQLWVKDYVMGNTNIMAFAAADDDTPATVFPAFLRNHLLTNAPGISLDDIGMQYVNRRHLYSAWNDFPRPTWVTNSSTTVESLTSTGITNVSSLLTNVFDTVSIELISLANSQKWIQTGNLRTADLHNRKFFLTHTNLTGGGHQAILTLSPFNPATTGQSSFTNDVALTNRQVLTLALDGTDDQLRLRIRHRRQHALTWPAAVDAYNGFLQLGSSREVLQERSLRKGDLAGICLNMGRVTPAMLRVHAQELWNMEQQLNTNAAAADSIPREVYQGSLVHLLGMSYYERTARFDELNSRLNKVQKLSAFAMGLAKLSPRRDSDGSLYEGNIDPVWPNVDMFFQNVTLAANGMVHLDSGWGGDIVGQNYINLRIADLSAQEHAVLNKFFGQSKAVSTVKVLQLAQAKVATGGSPVVELNALNYQSAGNVSYNGKALKDHDPAMWSQVAAFFESDIGLFSVGWMPPGTQTTTSGSFSGMAALLLSADRQVAIIGNNQYGAYGDAVSSGSLAQDKLPQMSVRTDSQNNYSASFSDPQAGQFRSAFESFALHEAGDYSAWLNNNALVANPDQMIQAQMAGWMLNSAPGTYSDLFPVLMDLGSVGNTSFKEGNGVLGWIADPVNTMSGEFYVDNVDLSLPGPMPLELRRNYGSHNLAANQLGYGWKLNYMPFLSMAASNIVYVAEPSGSVLAYGPVATNLWAPTAALNPSLNNYTENGAGSVANYFNARLAKVTTGGTNFYYLTNSDGALRVFEEKAFPLGGFDRERPYLTRWFDNRGNHYRFEYGTNVSQADYGQVRRIVGSSGNILRFEYDVYGRIVNAYSADGRRVQYDFDAHGDLVTVTRPDMSELQYEYLKQSWTTNGATNVYSTHLLVRENKPDGRVLKNEYDSQRRVTNQWATVGPDLRLVRNGTFRYTNNFNLTNLTATLTGTTTVLDFLNNATTYFYTNGLIRRVRDPLSAELVQEWYEANETNAPAYPRSLKKVTDKRGLVSEYKYDPRGNVTNTVVRGDLLGDGNTSTAITNTAAYNVNNLPTLTVDARGTTNLFFYTNTWLPVRVETWPLNASAGQAVTTLYTYATATNGTDGTVSYGLRTREVRAAGSTDAATNDWSYSSRGFPVSLTRHTGTADPAVTVSNVYNTRGELIQAIIPQFSTTQLGYDPRGNLQSREVFANGQSVPMAWDFNYYNENGELTWSDGPRFNPEDYVWRDYDGAGRQIQELRWRSQAKTDGTGVEAAGGDGGVAATFLEYDAFGNLTRTVDPRANYSLKKYDAIGQLLREEFYDSTGALLATNGLAYNAAGDVTNVFNALGGSTQKQYTSTGKPRFQKNTDGSTNAWRYYADGRLRREIQRNGAYWENVYDDANRTATRIFYSSAGVALATNASVFDRRGNVVQQTDAAFNTFTSTYDDLDRIKVSAGPVVETVVENCGMVPNCGIYVTNSLQQIAAYSYDASGAVLTVTNALGEKTITTSDALGRPVSAEIRTAANALIRVTTTGYSQDHHSVTVTNGSGASAIVSTVFTDNDGRSLLNIAYPSANVREYTWREYDLAGNLVYEERDSSDSGAVTGWSGTASDYDGLNRLTVRSDRDSALTTFAYNALGNQTNRTMPSGLQWSASYNDAGQMLKEWNTGSGGVIARTNSYAYYAIGSPHAGLLQTSVDGRGVTCAHSYDDWLRPSANTYSDMITTMGYDSRGFLTYINEEPTELHIYSYSVVRSYDPYGQLSDETVGVGDLYFQNTQSWDAAGRRTGLALANSGFKYAYGWRADGLLASAGMAVGVANYGYDTAGVLTNRSVGNRETTVASRDGSGRPLSVTTKVNTLNKLAETLGWTGDGLLSTHTLAREDFTDSRSYSYTNLSRRLIEERVNLDATKRHTNVFGYDGGTASGAGVLTRAAGGSSSASPVWSGGSDSFSRINAETNTAIVRSAHGRINGQAALVAMLDGQPSPTTLVSDSAGSWPYQWRAMLELTPGAHQLVVSATHPSGQFTTNATSWFTNTAANETTLNTYDTGGFITQRIWKNSGGSTNRTQSFSWDARGRLSQVSERDTNSNGFDWTATYDPLGRRVACREWVITNGLLSVGRFTYSFFDPQVEFLELGVWDFGLDVNRVTSKLYGPDSSGMYGAMQGVGGLEAVSTSANEFTPVIADARGNVIGSVANGDVTWTAARPTGYGAVAGYRPLPFGHGADMTQASAWRGRWADITGLIWLGARYYDPIAGRFMSSDPVWNGRDPNYYSFAGGDPINYFDADGRLAKHAGNNIYNGGLAGSGLRELGGYLDSFQSDSAVLSGLAGYYGSLANNAAGMVTPATYVDGLQSYGNNVSTIYREDGFVTAASYATTSWNVGAVWSGAANINLATGEPVGDWYQRGAVISGGVAGTAAVASGGLGLYNWATTPAVTIANPVPSQLARVVDASLVNRPTLGFSASSDVFVTAANDIRAITTSQGLANRLTLLDKAGNLRQGPFAVIQFDTPASGLASPVFRNNPGFIQGGLTGGGASEFVLPNMSINQLQNVSTRIIP